MLAKGTGWHNKWLEAQNTVTTEGCGHPLAVNEAPLLILLHLMTELIKAHESPETRPIKALYVPPATKDFKRLPPGAAVILPSNKP